MRQPVRWLAATALAASLAASCGSSGGSAKPSSTTTAPNTDASPVTTRDQLKDQILADYRKANDAYHDAINAGDPNLPSLEATHTGLALATIQRNLTKRAAAGQHGVDGPHSRITDRAAVQQVLDRGAVVQDCRIDDGKIVDSKTGAPVDATVSTNLVRIAMVQEGGVWKASTNEVLKKTTGVGGCAES